jgi:hypothetical protein
MPNKAIAAADGHKIPRCPSIYIELENTCVRPSEVWCSEKAREEHLDQPYQLLFDTEIRLLAEDADHLSIPNHHLASEVTGHPDLQLGLIAGAPPTRFACGRDKQVSRLSKCPSEILVGKTTDFRLKNRFKIRITQPPP